MSTYEYPTYEFPAAFYDACIKGRETAASQFKSLSQILDSDDTLAEKIQMVEDIWTMMQSFAEKSLDHFNAEKRTNVEPESYRSLAFTYLSFSIMAEEFLKQYKAAQFDELYSEAFCKCKTDGLSGCFNEMSRILKLCLKENESEQDCLNVLAEIKQSYQPS